MKNTRIQDNSKLKQEINQLKQQLKSVIHTEESYLQQQQQLMKQLINQKKNSKNIGSQVKTQRSRSKKLKSNRKEFYRPSSQNRVENQHSKSVQKQIPTQLNLQSAQTRKKTTNQNQRDLNKKLSLSGQPKDIIKQLQKLKKHLEIKIQDIQLMKSYRQGTKTNQNHLSERIKQSERKNLYAKKNTQNQSLKSNSEMNNSTDKRKERNISKEIEQLYRNIDLLQSKQDTFNMSQKNNSFQQQKQYNAYSDLREQAQSQTLNATNLESYGSTFGNSQNENVKVFDYQRSFDQSTKDFQNTLHSNYHQESQQKYQRQNPNPAKNTQQQDLSKIEKPVIRYSLQEKSHTTGQNISAQTDQYFNTKNPQKSTQMD